MNFYKGYTMRSDFDKYLTEQKKQNLYSSKMGKVIIKEGLFDNKEYKGAEVVIDLKDKHVIETLANIYKDNSKARTTTALDKGEDEFIAAVKDDMVELFKHLKNATRNLNKLFALNKNNLTALASVEVNTNEITYVFFRGPKKNPQAFAKRFRDEVARDPLIAPLSKAMDINDRTFYKNDVRNSRDNEPYFDPEKHADAIKNSPLVSKIISELTVKLSREIKSAEEKTKKGNLITVYSVPYTIDDELIKEVMKNPNSTGLNKFYEILVTHINKNLENILSQISDISEYIGFIPTKSYGLNLYFKDKDTAEIVSEKLNGDTSKVSERKRFEKKLGDNYQIFIKSTKDTLSGLRAAGDDADAAKDYFKGTLFARKHIAGIVKEKFPAADDQHVVLQYIVRYDNEELKKLLSNFNLLDHDDKHIRPAFKAKLKDVRNNIQKVYNDELIALNSEGTNLVFTFKSSASIDSVKNRIASAMTCSLSAIKVQKTTITEKEAQAFHKQLDELDDLESFYLAIDKLKGSVDSFSKNQKVAKVVIKLKDDFIKTMLSDKYKDEAKNLIDQIIQGANESKEFLGLTTPVKDTGVINMYFKSKESFDDTIKDKMLAAGLDKFIDGFNEPEMVTISAENARSITTDPTSFIEYCHKLYTNRQDNEVYQFTINYSYSKFIENYKERKLGDILNSAGKLYESFKTNLKYELIKTINLLSEAKKSEESSPLAAAKLSDEHLKVLEANKDTTLIDFINDSADTAHNKVIIKHLIDSAWKCFGLNIKTSLLHKYSEETLKSKYSSGIVIEDTTKPYFYIKVIGKSLMEEVYTYVKGHMSSTTIFIKGSTGESLPEFKLIK